MSETMTGTIVGGRYRITGLQRAGRMGDVFVGRRVDTDERVSIKVLDRNLFDNREAVRRFERETRITKRLDSPCTLVVQDYGQTEEGLPWMVLEFVQGEQLSDVIEAGKLAPDRAAYIAAQIAMALSEAHSIGVVHRDLSPVNVLLTDAGDQVDSVKVIDFGLSRLSEQGDDGEAEGSQLTAVGVRIGTPTYMAPEYIDSHMLDHRADLYALGILLFEMLTGEPPFTGRPYKVLDKHLTEIPPPPSGAAPGVPAWLDRLVAQLLEKDPDKRLQSADDVVAQIERGLGIRLQTVQTVPVAAEQTPMSPIRVEPAAEEQVARDEQTLPPADVSQDPILNEFMDRQILQHRGASGSLDPRHTFVVGGVATHSIAGRLGIQPGWHVEIPDLEMAAAMVDSDVFLQPVEGRQYRVADADGQLQFELATTGADPGMDLMRSSRHVRHFHNPTRDDPAPLLDVWRQGDWETLDKLAWRTITQQRGAAGMLNTGMFARFLGQAQIKLRDHPALLLYGAAKLEAGELEEGFELVQEYKDRYAMSWAPEYDAIAHYYLARIPEAKGDLDAALDMLVQGWVRWPCSQIHTKIFTLTGHTPDTRVWFGRQFPNYKLDEVEGNRHIHLYDELSRMPDHQVQLVCMMGGFRGNGVYDEFMRRYLAFNAHFAPFLAGLHVVTHRTLRDEDRPEHYGGEDLVNAAGLDFVLLEDYRAFVQRAVKPPQIPTIYGLDREGWVVHEGRLDSVGLWDMLATAAQVRMQRGG